MLSKSLKRKAVKISLSFIGIGLILIIVGFSIGKFDLDTFKAGDYSKWYRTIRFEDNSFSLEPYH